MIESLHARVSPEVLFHLSRWMLAGALAIPTLVALGGSAVLFAAVMSQPDERADFDCWVALVQCTVISLAFFSVTLATCGWAIAA